LDDAREKIAEILDADLAAPRPRPAHFHQRGHEANNLAVLGNRASRRQAARPNRPLGRRTSSVLEPVEHLWNTAGKPTRSASRRRRRARRAIVPAASIGKKKPCRCPLVSVQLANHETGVLQPVAELRNLPALRRAVAYRRTQVVGKLPVSFRALDVAAMSVAAHKLSRPLGIGALLLRDGVPIEPLMFGGHQQAGLTAGHRVDRIGGRHGHGPGAFDKERKKLARRLTALRDRFEHGIRAGCIRSSSTASAPIGFPRRAA